MKLRKLQLSIIIIKFRKFLVNLRSVAAPPHLPSSCFPLSTLFPPSGLCHRHLALCRGIWKLCRLHSSCRWQLNEAKIVPLLPYGSWLMPHRVAADELPATLSNSLSVSLSVCLSVWLPVWQAKVAVKS